uniref:CBM21 domain-containing protein n=1 Tax=Otus sunia TaxID=257818 RepID=A0A8C8B6M6_9STRI
ATAPQPRPRPQPEPPTPSAEPERRDSTRSSEGQKTVVFADTKGLSLTAVRFFSKIQEDLCGLQHALSDLTCLQPGLRGSRPAACRYVLDFPQPSADYVAFCSRLHSNPVCLESCLVQDRALSGTVRVRNIEYEKKVMVCITFDGWKSFRDISCQYLRSTCGSTHTDVFSFKLVLPKPSVSHRATEFCISFHCGQKTHWDNNHVDTTCPPSRPVKSAGGPGAPGHLSGCRPGPFSPAELVLLGHGGSCLVGES